MMPIILSLEEKETVFSIVAADRNTVNIYSDDEVYQRRLEKIGATLVSVEKDGFGRHYTLPANQLSLRNPAKPKMMTEEQREAMVERFRVAREKQAAERAENPDGHEST